MVGVARWTSSSSRTAFTGGVAGVESSKPRKPAKKRRVFLGIERMRRLASSRFAGVSRTQPRPPCPACPLLLVQVTLDADRRAVI